MGLTKAIASAGGRTREMDDTRRVVSVAWARRKMYRTVMGGLRMTLTIGGLRVTLCSGGSRTNVCTGGLRMMTLLVIRRVMRLLLSAAKTKHAKAANAKRTAAFIFLVLLLRGTCCLYLCKRLQFEN